MAIKVTNNMKKFLLKNTNVLDSAVATMTKDVATIAKINMPYLTGDMQDETRVEKLATLNHRVVVDTEYAAYQEAGQRKDGTHVVTNYSTPSTNAHFLENAGNKVKKDSLNYLKQAANSIHL